MAWWVKRRKGDKTVFSDSNGDGLINEKDTVAINQNLLKSHPVSKINKNNTYGYQYDANGNMTLDEYKNIDIHYNHLNLPDTIIAHEQGKIINIYLADGSLLQRKVLDIEGKEIDRLDYQGEFLFHKDHLSKMMTDEGYISPSASNKKRLTYYYVVSDHLGHSRVVLDEKENVVQTTAYYPYGLPITDLSSEIKNNYLYTGKEFIGEFGLNWYDHHARQYDAEIGRWSAIDPALQAASPYMAMGNNPMIMVDTDGKTWGIFKGIKNAWDYVWDKGNQFARWAEENGIPSAGIGVNYNNGSGFSPNANVNGQPLDLSGEIASINRGVANINYSFFSQMNNYRAYNRARIPLISVEPPIRTGVWVVPEGEDFLYQTFEQAQRSNAWKEWHSRASGRVEITDSPIDYIIGAGIGKAIVSRTIARRASRSGTTIIGEGMLRVEVAAAKIPKAKILNDMPSFTGTAGQITSKMMQHNRKWLLNELRSGRTIMDIGHDLNRTNPSIFYQMEQNMLKNYQILHPNSLKIINP